MKKVYLLTAAVLFGMTVSAQTITYEEDFESFETTSPVSGQSSFWRTWGGINGGADDGFVVDDLARSGEQSLFIDDSNVMDLVLLIPGAPTTGIHSVQWYTYIPAGGGAYFNMQAELTPEGTAWEQALMGGNNYMNCDGTQLGMGGTTGVIDCSAFNQTFDFPEDEWFKVTTIYDLDNETWTMLINDEEVFDFQESFAFGDQIFMELAGINFFSASTHNEMYIDDLRVAEGEFLDTPSFAENTFTVYPNPVQDVLNINAKETVDAVTVFDILGKQVLSVTPNTRDAKVDFSALTSGAYFVRVTVNGISDTVKVIK